MTERPRLHQSKAVQVLNWLLDDLERKHNQARETAHGNQDRNRHNDLAS